MTRTTLILAAVATVFIVTATGAEARCNNSGRNGCWNTGKNINSRTTPDFAYMADVARRKEINERFDRYKVKQSRGEQLIKGMTANKSFLFPG